MTDFQIQRLVQERRLEEITAADSDLLGFLTKAARALQDAGSGISEEGAFLRAYEATFLCATAALLNAGYRLRGSAEGHHNDLVLALRHLGVPELASLGNRWERLKRIRNQALYDGETRPAVADVSEMRSVANEMLGAVSQEVVRVRPAAAQAISDLPRAPRAERSP